MAMESGGSVTLKRVHVDEKFIQNIIKKNLIYTLPCGFVKKKEKRINKFLFTLLFVCS